MLKICYVIGQLNRGGAERQLYELVRGIDGNEFHPVVISLSSGGCWVEELRDLGIEVVELRRRRNREVSRLYSLVRLFRTIRPDIVHTYLYSANSYGRIAAVITGVPVIIASERSLPEAGKDKDRGRILLDRILARFSHGIICNSRRAAETLVEKYAFDAGKVFTVHNGINPDDFFREAGRHGRPETARKSVSTAFRTVGTVGRLHPSKNYRLFLDAARIVLERAGSRVNFIVIGDGESRAELQRYAQRSGIADRVVFTGERSDVPAMLEEMDVFVMTSLYEGLSNAMMEAMLAGLPVVATDVGGNRELITDGENGFLCPPGDASSLAERILYLLDNGQEAARMGLSGRQRILTEFSAEKMVRATEGIYRKLAAEHRRGLRAF
ncbi:MAG: glycosyltransferase [Nitrospirae bacterium]|nr:glycosyltransferase [Nitrospirota bacterium]